MTVRVGIVGLGFMGKCHFDSYKALRGAKVAAICDIDPKKRKGDWSSIAGNIGGAGGRVDLSGIKTYAKADELFADPDIDVVDITLPTDVHAQYALSALAAGKHVICEKPLARHAGDAARLARAASRSGRFLFAAHCIRFWPAYAEARDLVRSKKYGKVLSAAFRRLSPTPTWSWNNWLMDSSRSGDCVLDLHIHDADFVRYCFGEPRSVSAFASGMKPGRMDHVLARYEYGDNLLVTAEGGWDFRGSGYPFEMSFQIVMEKACLRLAPDGVLTLHPNAGKPKPVKLPSGDGYTRELAHFIERIGKGKASAIVTPADAAQSVRLIEAEVASIRKGKPVTMR